jgi:Fuc2NAc and GlcNAc transferase
MQLISLAAIVLLSGLLTGLIRAYAIRAKLVDVPNQRSSHTVPTPRGGGLAIALISLVTLSWFTIKFDGSPGTWGIIAGAFLVALVSWLDDHMDLSARWRILVHFAAATICVWSLGSLPTLHVLNHAINPGMFGNILAVLTLVWFTNLYNFMDGIDGIAGIEAVTVFTTLAVLLAIFSPGTPWQTWCLVLSAATLGFLVWNIPTARIFMGDCGSAFLGFVLGAMMLATSHVDEVYLWVVLILMAVFITDSTLTLARRFFRGEKVYLAHRDHGYQHAALEHRSHLKVSLAIGAINLFWLGPIAALVMTRSLAGSLGILIAYFPLLLLGLRYRSGTKSSTATAP